MNLSYIENNPLLQNQKKAPFRDAVDAIITLAAFSRNVEVLNNAIEDYLDLEREQPHDEENITELNIVMGAYQAAGDDVVAKQCEKAKRLIIRDLLPASKQIYALRENVAEDDKETKYQLGKCVLCLMTLHALAVNDWSNDEFIDACCQDGLDTIHIFNTNMLNAMNAIEGAGDQMLNDMKL